jgi:hypothetical protein
MQCQCQCHASVPNHGERAARAYYHRTTTTGNTLPPARPDWPNPAGSARKQSSNQCSPAHSSAAPTRIRTVHASQRRRRRRREDKRRKKIIGKGEKKSLNPSPKPADKSRPSLFTATLPSTARPARAVVGSPGDWCVDLRRQDSAHDALSCCIEGARGEIIDEKPAARYSCPRARDAM